MCTTAVGCVVLYSGVGVTDLDDNNLLEVEADLYIPTLVCIDVRTACTIVGLDGCAGVMYIVADRLLVGQVVVSVSLIGEDAL